MALISLLAWFPKDYSLDGIDDYVDIGDLAQLDYAAEITVMAWIKKASDNNPWWGIVGKSDSAPSDTRDNTFLLYGGGKTAPEKGGFVVVFDNRERALVTGTTDVAVGEWTF